MQVFKNAGIQACTYMQVCMYVHMQVCKYASTQVFKYASMQVCMYASMQVSKYAFIEVRKCTSVQVCKFTNVQAQTKQSLGQKSKSCTGRRHWKIIRHQCLLRAWLSVTKSFVPSRFTTLPFIISYKISQTKNFLSASCLFYKFNFEIHKL